ncbi:hypothetical protein ASPWEDRAFT_39598 [Aspergillus wentii DTO 134E9]|uniref:Uncharacterized protein n=1 Tax=Aspergillus wentii DTO 134E9 TaxID=1073089 RepID=A0A1L9RSK1_ASPWE|nr:uncharacterized protein ASPWEDRAFT_39598 [Aspergillus wentii DTO 134E9]OJJ37874.1 hypothetical protein ASPWEDRAFT_39598 [Aspergillus wentii DTO 134E9]
MSTNDEDQLSDAIINEFTAAGYTTDQIETILDRQHSLKHEPEGPTWIKVHRKYLLPDTLMAYRLPWDWDEVCASPASWRTDSN